jgi:hypothetical protein
MKCIETPQAGAKPVMLWDIDGVLVLFAPTEQKGYVPYPDKKHSYLAYNPKHGEWIRGFARHTEQFYISDWAVLGKAHEYIGQHLELPELPGINTDAFKTVGKSRRRAAISHIFPHRPVAWIDDELKSTDYEWAAKRNEVEAPTLLVQPERTTGLLLEHTQEITTWLGSLGIQACDET